MAGSMFSRFSPAEQHAEPRENWAGNLTYSTDNLFIPASADEAVGRRQALQQAQSARLAPLFQRHRRQQREPDFARSS